MEVEAMTGACDLELRLLQPDDLCEKCYCFARAHKNYLRNDRKTVVAEQDKEYVVKQTATLMDDGEVSVSTEIGEAPYEVIPQDDGTRKAAPMYRGLLGYFPGALFHVAAHSMRSDRKHNAHMPEEGAPRWNRGASKDHDDCIVRHTAEQHSDPLYHKTARAWRALADLQEYLEQELGYAPGAHSVPEEE